ncbi:sugar transferase [Aureivirga sp. CE67]|uniref:sugar transferase n=1 Tax=Aureivirga sp. CE67 TaxID=1788983 RepID=UPI001E57D8F0|nr:sugar transferase [Aureivirga sp. CE67]
MISKKGKIYKRIFDLCFSFFGLIALSPLLFLLIFLASISFNSFGVFSQKRIGQFGNPFYIFKIKTMYPQKNNENFITVSNDKRSNAFGHFLRKYKLDELPQLINILIGNMSFVGPRPDVPGYADCLTDEDRIILEMKPGITSPASIYFRNEEEILATQKNPKKYNDEIIWPKKIILNREYVENWSMRKDFKCIFETLF